MGPCASVDQLERLLDERLDDRQQVAVEDHVEGCSACRQALEELAVARDEVQGRKPPAPDPGRDAGGPGFLRSFKDRGPPRLPGPPAKADASTLADQGGRSSPGERGPAAGPRPSPTIAGFRIVREVGHGGMGVVYEAIELALDRRSALKVLLAHRATSTVVERFQREARAAAGLHHAHIVPVHGVGEDHGQLYYVMQFIEGESLGPVFNRLGAHEAATPDSNSASLSTEGSDPA
jgi:Protein kinase domain